MTTTQKYFATLLILARLLPAIITISAAKITPNAVERPLVDVFNENMARNTGTKTLYASGTLQYQPREGNNSRPPKR
jgi:glycosyltransferase A (GT-A) superfamily protein (DUF2064 family)